MKKYKSRKWGHSNNKSGASISFRPKEARLVGAWWRDAQRLYAQFHSITLSCLFHGRLRLKPISTLSFRHSCCLDQGHGHYQENGLQVDIIEPQTSFSHFAKGCYMLKFSIQKKVNPVQNVCRNTVACTVRVIMPDALWIASFSWRAAVWWLNFSSMTGKCSSDSNRSTPLL